MKRDCDDLGSVWDVGVVGLASQSGCADPGCGNSIHDVGKGYALVVKDTIIRVGC